MLLARRNILKQNSCKSAVCSIENTKHGKPHHLPGQTCREDTGQPGTNKDNQSDCGQKVNPCAEHISYLAKEYSTDDVGDAVDLNEHCTAIT